MRRLLSALFITLGLWFIASVVFVIVAHLNGRSSLLYLLGALVIVPIPVMLVLLFAIMQRVLKSDEAGTPIATEITAAVARSFPAEEQAEAVAILATYDALADEPRRMAVQRAILRLSEGDLDRLGYFTDQAKADDRDVLAWDAERADPHEI